MVYFHKNASRRLPYTNYFLWQILVARLTPSFSLQFRILSFGFYIFLTQQLPESLPATSTSFSFSCTFAFYFFLFHFRFLFLSLSHCQSTDDAESHGDLPDWRSATSLPTRTTAHSRCSNQLPRSTQQSGFAVFYFLAKQYQTFWEISVGCHPNYLESPICHFHLFNM